MATTISQIKCRWELAINTGGSWGLNTQGRAPGSPQELEAEQQEWSSIPEPSAVASPAMVCHCPSQRDGHVTDAENSSAPTFALTVTWCVRQTH